MVRVMKDLMKEAKRDLSKGLPRLILMLGFAIIIWIIGAQIIAPIGRALFVFGFEFVRIIRWITLFFVGLFVIGALVEIRRVADGLGAIITYGLMKAKPGKETTKTVRKVQEVVRAFLYVIVVVWVYMLIRPMLVAFHPVLAGISALIIAVWALSAVYKAIVIALESM